MSTSRLARRLVPVVLAAQLLLPAAASAHGPDACANGPARLAGPDAPHAWDTHGTDASAGLGTAAAAAYGDAGDVIDAWISGPSAWEDRTAPQTFTATIRLESLKLQTAPGSPDHAPVLARYYMGLAGAGGERWVRAVFESPGTWSFAYGTLNGTTFTQEGTTTGTVDTAGGTISINIPSQLLPSRPSNGQAVQIDMTLARSYLRYPNGVSTGALVLVDQASGLCKVGLYEAAPPQ